FGNSMLSLLAKLSSGYWNIVDPTNGFIAMTTEIFRMLPQQKISKRFFFETDILFRLNLMRAYVADVPMRASYGGETSNMRIHRIILPFMWNHLRNFLKRIIYSYFIRDFSIGSIYLLLGVPLILFGVGFGIHEWVLSFQTKVVASAGTVMLSALPIVLGF